MPDPKGFTYNPSFEPDKDRMIQALQTVLEAPKRRKEAVLPSEQDETGADGAA